MKNKQFPKETLPYLIIGLLTVTTTPVISRYYHLPDFVTGFTMGLGLALEFVALVKIRMHNRASCGAGTNLRSSETSA